MAKQTGGEALRARREAMKLSQRELAQLLDMSPNEISMYELGRRVPGRDRAVRMKKRIGLPVEVWS